MNSENLNASSKRIVITGGTGFLGQALIRYFIGRNYTCEILTRSKMLKPSSKSINYIFWDAQKPDVWQSVLEKATAVIHLAGENIASGVWTKRKKERILNSRIATGRLISQAIAGANTKPGIFFQASAIGFYGGSCHGSTDESGPKGNGFLASVAEQWEASTSALHVIDICRIVMRMGIILGRNGGMLSKTLLPFRFNLGSYPGNGTNYWSWIHVEDVCRAIEFLIHHPNPGIYNFTSPNPARVDEFF
jgi:uncharacterized protein